jgi:hypothetical protein
MLTASLSESDPTRTPSVHRGNRANFVCAGQGAGSAEQSGPSLMARVNLACAGELDPLAHLSVSSVISLPKSAGVIGGGAPPQSASRAFIVGNWIERLIGISKSAAAVVIRYDQLAETFPGMLNLAAVQYWIKIIYTA